MDRFLLTALFVFLSFTRLCAQDKEYDEWLKKEKQKFEQYLSEEDKKFTDFLRKEWIQQGLNPADFPMEKPKPKTPPVYTPDDDAGLPPPDKLPEPQSAPPPLPDPQPQVTPPPVVVPPAGINTSVYTEMIDFSYYGTGVQVPFNPRLAISTAGEINGDAIADFWKDFSSQEHKELISHFQELKSSLKLNDFGFVLLIYQTASGKYRTDNERVLFTWFVLNKSGYRARVAYLKKDLFLLLQSDNQVFGVTFFIDHTTKKKFYMIPFGDRPLPAGSIYIYKEDFPDAVTPVSFGFDTMPQLGSNEKSRNVSFMYRGQQYQIVLIYNEPLTGFFEWYPQIDFRVYFSSGLHARSSENLLGQLRPLIKDLNQTEAANFLLHFVQQATEYKTDDEQFQREKPLFVEESLRYSYSDCEDRSVLFAYLVRQLLGLEVIGLDFPDHIATAVRFTEPISGDSIEWKGKKYYICDPTYIGADIAICMPAYKKINPEIIVTK